MVTNTENNISYQYFTLYPYFIPVWGKRQSILVNVLKGEYFNIPNSLFEILKDTNESIKVEEISSKIPKCNSDDVENILKYLVREGVGVFTSDFNLFKKLNFEFNSPYIINNEIIEIDDLKTYCLTSLLKDLHEINCQNIEIRIINSHVFDEVIQILTKYENSIFRSIQLICFSNEHIMNNSLNLIERNRKISKVLIFDSKNTEVKKSKSCHKTIYISEIYKEQLDEVDFIINPFYFFESHHYNASFNQKLSIDKNGNIKNHLTHDKTFGNINNKKLKSILKDTDFQSLWYITNDSIEICKECELRYFCLSFSDVSKVNGKCFKNNYCNNKVKV